MNSPMALARILLHRILVQVHALGAANSWPIIIPHGRALVEGVRVFRSSAWMRPTSRPTSPISLRTTATGSRTTVLPTPLHGSAVTRHSPPN